MPLQEFQAPYSSTDGKSQYSNSINIFHDTVGETHNGFILLGHAAERIKIFDFSRGILESKLKVWGIADLSFYVNK